LNPRKIERVAKAICRAAKSNERPMCLWCETPQGDRTDGQCCHWQEFEKEAVAALKAIKGF
jgi:transketolase